MALDDDHVTRLHVALALFLAASLVVFLPATLMDSRVVDHAQVWIKPQKFNLSLAVHFLTLALLAQLLPRETRSGPVLMLFSYLAAAALLLEYLYISVQAGRARRSHFNYDSDFESMMYAAMGIGAVLLVTVALVMAIQLWRRGVRTHRGLWLGAVLGLGIGSLLTLLFASYMSSTGRYVGGPLEGGGAVVPLVGWSREYGDLRPAHFVSLHLMQTLPLMGWFADRQRWPAKSLVVGLAAAQIALATFLFIQARSGQPFWPV